LVVTLFLILLVVGGIVWWSKRESTPQPGGSGGGRTAAPMSIVPETVGQGDIGININALGTVTSLATVTIRSQISGYMMKIDFKEGDEVKKGDLLAEIDSRPYEATLAQAKGALARDEAMLKGAQVDLVRYQGLAAQNAVPHQQLDTQTALVAQDQGLVEADRAAVKSAEVNLQYCRILSPLDGRVGLRQVDQGNYVTPGDTNGIVVVNQLQPITVIFPIPEDNVPALVRRLREGGALAVEAYDRTNSAKLADGKLLTIDNQIDVTTGTVKLRAQFENADGLLFPNQFVNIQLLQELLRNQIIIPNSAVRRGAPNGVVSTFVYAVNPDRTVKVRPITLGVVDGEHVAVNQGLSAGEVVVTEGGDRLREGAQVQLPNATAPAAAAHPHGNAQPGSPGSAGPRRPRNHPKPSS